MITHKHDLLVTHNPDNVSSATSDVTMRGSSRGTPPQPAGTLPLPVVSEFVAGDGTRETRHLPERRGAVRVPCLHQLRPYWRSCLRPRLRTHCCQNWRIATGRGEAETTSVWGWRQSGVSTSSDSNRKLCGSLKISRNWRKLNILRLI